MGLEEALEGYRSTARLFQAAAPLRRSAGKPTGTPTESRRQHSNLQGAEDHTHVPPAEPEHGRRTRRPAAPPAGPEPEVGRSPTCRTEEEGLGFFQVLVHGVGDGHLSMSEGAESPFISGTHLALNVIKEQREAPAAKLLHLRDTEVGVKVEAGLNEQTRTDAV